MTALQNITIDNLINLYVYEGIILSDRELAALLARFHAPKICELKRRCLEQDTMILGALRCAKANGYTGEE